MAARPRSPNLFSQLLPAYQRLRRQIQHLRTGLETFEGRDRPAWDTWMATHFRDQTRRIDALQEELTRLAARLQAANQLALSGDFPSRQAAYAEILRQEQDDPAAESATAGREPATEPDLLLESILHQLFQEGLATGQAETPPVKQLYRNLAKRLHPDHNPAGGALEEELWRETQLAYQARDARTLEIIELRHRLESGAPPAPSDSEPLRALVFAWTEVRDTLREELRAAQHTPAWGFALQSPEAREGMATTTRRTLDTQLTMLQRRLQTLRQEEARLTSSSAPSSSRTTKPGRRPRCTAEEIGMAS